MNGEERILNVLDGSRCLSQNQLLSYLDGNLYPEELRTVEMHLASCQLCDFALEGLSRAGNPNLLIESLTPPKLPNLNFAKEEAKVEKAVHETERPVHKQRERSSLKRPVLMLAGLAILGLAAFGVIWDYQQQQQVLSDDWSYADTDVKEVVENETLGSDKATPAHPVISQIEHQSVASPIDEANEAAEAAHVADQAATVAKASDALPEARRMERFDTVAAATTAKHSDREKPETRQAESAKSKEIVKETAKPTTSQGEEAAPAVAEQPKKSSFSDYETGLSLFRKEQYASALLYLSTAAADKNDKNHWDAVYYSALCNKYLDKRGKAKRMFKQIVKAEAPRKAEAEKQLEELGGS